MHSEVVTSRIITVIILFNIQLAPDFVGCWAQPQAEAPLAPTSRPGKATVLPALLTPDLESTSLGCGILEATCRLCTVSSAFLLISPSFN